MRTALHGKFRVSSVISVELNLIELSAISVLGSGKMTTQCFIKQTLIERNNKEIIAHLRDKHFECCIFNIVQYHH